MPVAGTPQKVLAQPLDIAGQSDKLMDLF